MTSWSCSVMKAVGDHFSSNFLPNHSCKFCSFLSARSGWFYSLDSENVEKVE